MYEKKIAERLKFLRTEHNLKQEDLARVLGIDRSGYSGYETGRTKLSVKNLCRLADIYNVPLSSLVGRQEKEEAVRVKVASVSVNVDPIALFDRDEQLLIMYYRLADEETKKRIFELLEQINQ